MSVTSRRRVVPKGGSGAEQVKRTWLPSRGRSPQRVMRGSLVLCTLRRVPDPKADGGEDAMEELRIEPAKATGRVSGCRGRRTR